MKSDPRVDAYIDAAPAYAQPILRHLRSVLHAACPQGEETMKWSRPHVLYRGRMLCGMSAFKQHVALGFWLGDLVVNGKDDSAMGQFGRIASLADLPSKTALIAFVRKAMALNDAGTKSPMRSRPATRKPEAEVPADLAAALAKNAKARATFTAFSPSHRREYIEWLLEAKREETRSKRLAQTLEWLAEGKQRNWKYANC